MCLACGGLPLSPGEAEPPVVEVAVPREFRGLWVATVVNLDLPSRPGLDDDALRQELDLLVDTAADTGFNALIVQVRSEADALYDSPLEPWSRFLTGVQGQAPGFDPLAYLIERAHGRTVEVHAWFNPYRAGMDAKATYAESHLSRRAPGATYRWGRLLWLDPGNPAVQEHAVAVVRDVVTRYDVDGVHLDDYFYPYPKGDKEFPDEASYATYRAAGGTLERDPWRRHNVDTMVQRLHDTVRSTRPQVRFGISPFGIYRPGQPEGIRGMDQVTALHADPMVWYREGWVDYLCPQLYWPTTRQAQRFDKLLDWWADHSDHDRPLLVGLDFTKVGRSAWSLDEVRTQLELVRQAPHTAGYIGFRARPILEDQAGLAALMTELQASPALPPPLDHVDQEVPPPRLHEDGQGFRVEAEERTALVRYQQVDGDWVVDQVFPRDTTELPALGRPWALSQVGPGGWESPALLLEAP